MTPPPPVEDSATDFDHTDPAGWPTVPIWEDLRQRCPVAHSDRYGGTWLPVTHDLVSEVGSTSSTSPPARSSSSTSDPVPTMPAPIGLSPPLPRTRPSTPWPEACCARLRAQATAALEPFTRTCAAMPRRPRAGELRRDYEYARHIRSGSSSGSSVPPGGRRPLRRFIRAGAGGGDIPAEDEEREARFGELDAYMDAQIDDHIAHPRTTSPRSSSGRRSAAPS